MYLVNKIENTLSRNLKEQKILKICYENTLMKNLGKASQKTRINT